MIHRLDSEFGSRNRRSFIWTLVRWTPELHGQLPVLSRYLRCFTTLEVSKILLSGVPTQSDSSPTFVSKSEDLVWGGVGSLTVLGRVRYVSSGFSSPTRSDWTRTLYLQTRPQSDTERVLRCTREKPRRPRRARRQWRPSRTRVFSVEPFSEEDPVG